MHLRYLLAASIIVAFNATPALSETLELQIADAQPMFDEATREGSVFVQLGRESAAEFGRFTRIFAQQSINVLIDDKVVATPFIQEAIVSGTFPISGLKSVEETNALSDRLRSGRSTVAVAPVN